MKREIVVRVSLLAGAAVAFGWFGIVSDSVPYNAYQYGWRAQFGWGFAGWVNDIVTWFVMAMISGSWLSRKLLASALAGGIWALVAVLLYVGFGGSGGFSGDTLLGWVVPAAVGGMFAGAWAWLAARYRVALMLIPLLVMGRIAMNGIDVLAGTVGQVHTYLLVALAVGAIVVWWRAKHSPNSTASLSDLVRS